MTTPKFKRVSAGLHRYVENDREYTLTQAKHSWTGIRSWDLNRGEGWINKGCNSICIPNIARGNDALRFITAIDEYLEGLGAVQTDRYDWKLETKVGILWIGPRANAVMCRFEDGDRARTMPDLNLSQHNSKWNFHWHEGTDVVSMFNIFKISLEKVLL